jgi:hypothetical protein
VRPVPPCCIVPQSLVPLSVTERLPFCAAALPFFSVCCRTLYCYQVLHFVVDIAPCCPRRHESATRGGFEVRIRVHELRLAPELSPGADGAAPVADTASCTFELQSGTLAAPHGWSTTLKRRGSAAAHEPKQDPAKPAEGVAEPLIPATNASEVSHSGQSRRRCGRDCTVHCAVSGRCFRLLCRRQAGCCCAPIFPSRMRCTWSRSSRHGLQMLDLSPIRTVTCEHLRRD